MCGRYGCENCENHKVWYSNDYWLPDEHECVIPDNAEPDFEVSNEELEDIFDRVWTYGDEWNTEEEQICPYYKQYIEKYF